MGAVTGGPVTFSGRFAPECNTQGLWICDFIPYPGDDKFPYRLV
jgi:hypothetical protein